MEKEIVIDSFIKLCGVFWLTESYKIIIIYVIEYKKGYDEESNLFRKVIESLRCWDAGTSRIQMKITSEPQSEGAKALVEADAIPCVKGNHIKCLK